MGVIGLTTYVEGAGPFRECRLRECSVVVDGYSLAGRIHAANERRARFGGEYRRLENDLEHFLEALDECAIRCYVVCDGGREPAKASTARRRHRAATEDALDPGRPAPPPLMLRDLLFETLRASGRDTVVCDLEADPEIAALARRLDAPVISYDSDFFVYDVRYVPVDRLDLRPVRPPDGGPFLRCEEFRPELLGVSRGHLRLAAALLGNDRVRRPASSAFLDRLGDGRPPAAALFRWLRNEPEESAAESALDGCEVGAREALSREIRAASDLYLSPRCRHLSRFGLGDERSERSELRLEPWLEELLRCGKVSPKFFDLVGGGVYYGTPQIEERRSPDAHACAFPVLRFSYDLATGFRRRGDLSFVGRKDGGTARIGIPRRLGPPPGLVPGSRPPPSVLDHFVSESLCPEVVAATRRAPDDAGLFLLAVVWSETCPDARPASRDARVLSLLLHFVVGPETRSPLRRHYGRPSAGKRDTVALHDFARFQCCFQQLRYLNYIASERFPAGRISRACDGTFFHNCYSDLVKRRDPRGHVAKALAGAPALRDRTLSMMESVSEAVETTSRKRKPTGTPFPSLIISSVFLFLLLSFCLSVVIK